eukprot:GHVL01043409.1.p1 GENE.GHVL01043409.1~~GHVL01043409.1.p1  ORF type:complete len:480 (+),score=74.78 GHVL01043409.1:37-1476(+)
MDHVPCILCILTAFFAFLFMLILIALCAIRFYFYKNIKIRQVLKKGKFEFEKLPSSAYDVCIVGAGPGGSTAAYYLAKRGYKVLVLEKKMFPRDKYCGDAVCRPALDILEDMGVLKELKDNDEIKFAHRGGLVGPSGGSFIGGSIKQLSFSIAGAVKRLHLDERIVTSAQRAGAALIEKQEVISAELDKELGIWTVKSNDATYKSRMLICADGATSSLATKLGYCTEAPEGICSRAYVEGGTHNVDYDGVCFYQKKCLPGYSAIFRHPKDELNFCCYLIPCGPKGMCGNAKAADLPELHRKALTEDPFISRSMGPNAKIERMRAGPLRIGSQGVHQTYDDHLMIVGDAAGHIGPLTGEGIHNAMIGGREAATVIHEMLRNGDFSSNSTRVYEDRWMKKFGFDFPFSQAAGYMIWKYPIILDACVARMQRKGDAAMAKWGEVMTCGEPKSYFLNVTTAFPLVIEIVKQYFIQKVSGIFIK